MPIDLTNFSPETRLGRAERLERGFALEVGEARFVAQVVRSDVLRLELERPASRREPPTPATSYEAERDVPFDVVIRPAEIVLTTNELELRVERGEFHFDVTRRDGTSVLASARDALGRSLAYQALNDAFALVRRARANDVVLGLGEKTGPLDRRGRSYTLFNVDVLAPDVHEHNRLLGTEAPPDPESTDFDPYYSSIPFFLHGVRENGVLRFAGSFVDNGWLARADFESPTELELEFTGGAYIEYVFGGPSVRRVVEAYTFVTGRASLPPLWTLGHQQCRWHDYTDRELLELAREYRRRRIPCDALWLDIGYMDGYRVFSFHPERFPEPERTFEALRADGFRTVTIIDPGVKREPGDAVFDAGVRGGHFCKTEGGELYEGRVWPGRTVFPDFVRDETRRFWSELVKRHAERGVAGIWNDMNEPATGGVPPFAMRFDRDGANHPHERFHNHYAFFMALATHAGLVAARPDERPFILSRAGSPGIQRVAAQWLGDHSASFAHLGMGLPMALGFGLSGQPFVGGDVPGFAAVATPELAARWFEYAALTPFCRCHHQIDLPDHYPWSFGAEVERVARDALGLRYRLLPYLYAAFLEATRSGAPVQRPLVFEFQDDPRAVPIEDQYMLGDALLVAPVLHEGALSRSVYLPPGTWVEWRSGHVHAGERTLDVKAPLGAIPLFLRGGCAVPLWETAPLTTFEHAPECVELHVAVPREDGTRTSVLYEDDGHSTAYRSGQALETRVEVTRVGRSLVVRGVTSGARFSGFRRQRLRVVFRGEVPVRLRLDGRPVALDRGAFAFAHEDAPFELTGELA
ncbi:MAG TPA: TIM-barrel domain-containing protein [Polyangiaceae bacterium]|nr:TIM-barrel domain-containing protein [Polyangiaceae bacterium]